MLKTKLKKRPERMIGLEHFRKIDLLAVLGLAVVYAILCYLMNTLRVGFVFEISIFTMSILATLTFLLVRKFGAAALFYVMGASLTVTTELAGTGLNKVLILLAMGITFELVVFVLRRMIFNVVLATAASNAGMPWLMLLFGRATSIPGIERLMPLIWNFTIMNFLLGVVGSLMGLGVWYKVKNTKAVLRFRYMRNNV